MKKFLFALGFLASTVFAAEGQPLSTETVKEKIESIYPNVRIDEVRPAKVKGFYEILSSGDVLYASDDGRFLIQGDVYELDDKSKPMNLTEETRQEMRQKSIKLITATDTIMFNAEKPKHLVYVFTDVDCGYCRMFHSKMHEYNELGISVAYLAFPRQGLNSEVARKMQSVWCGDKPAELFTKVVNDQSIPDKTCSTSTVMKDPVTRDFEFGASVGVRGTPSIMLDNGRMLGGYVDPKELASMLEKAN